MFFILVIVVLGGLYAAGVIRLQRRGDSWPWGRTAAWFAGLLVLGIALLTGVGTYSYVLFSMHMVQHMVLSMLVPILLVLGAPATLALRALPAGEAAGGPRPAGAGSPTFLHGWYARLVTHPGFATPHVRHQHLRAVFHAAVRHPDAGPLGARVHERALPAVGFPVLLVIMGVDPAPQGPFLLRIVLLLVAMGFHAFFGVAIMMKSEPLGMEYYGQSRSPWRDASLTTSTRAAAWRGRSARSRRCWC